MKEHPEIVKFFRFPAYVRTQRLARNAQYRGMQSKRQDTIAMMIPCLCSFTVLRTLAADCPVAQKIPKPIGLGIGGGRYRTRTCDLLHVKQMLYQLS